MSNKRKQIEDDQQTDLQKYTEQGYKALKKEKNVQLKQALEDDCDRGRDRTGELKDVDEDVTISVDEGEKNIADDKAILSASSKMSKKRKQIEDDDQADSLKYTERKYKALKNENVQLKQAVEDDCVSADRGWDRTDELKEAEVDVTISVDEKNIAINRAILSASSPSTPLRPIAPLVTRVHDPCLIALFKQLPPADQLTARKVCSRWADLVTYAARSTRSLAILLGDQTMAQFKDSVSYYSLGSIKVVSLLQKEDGSPMFPLERFSQWNTLLYRGGLDEATVEAIGGTFVNLNTLQIGLIEAPSSQMDTISHLLEVLAHHHQLATLKLCEAPDPLENHSPDRFFAAINGLTTLKNLHLDLGSLPHHDLPIISQLEQLHICWDGCSPQQFTALLRQHVTVDSSLRSIAYFCDDHYSDIEHFTSLSDHLLSRFTQFGFPWSLFTDSQLISNYFRHLISLYIRPTDITLHRLFDHLSQLTQLLYLGLDIHFSDLLPDDQPHLLLPQLKSVKALELRLVILSHLNLEQVKIGWTMPNLQAIDLRHFWQSKCTDCTIEEFSGNHIEANPTTFKHCLRQTLAPLKTNCSQLRTILYGYERFFGTADELLAE